MEATLRWRRSCCHWPGVKLAEVLVEELVALEGVAAAHVTGAAVVGAGVANGWSCSSCRCDERIPLLLFLRMKALEEVVSASAATVEVAVAEEDETGLQERERESRWLLGDRAGFLW